MLFVHFEKIKTQVLKKLRFFRRNSDFSEETQVFVIFQLTLLNTASRKLRYFSKKLRYFRKTQVFDYIAELRWAKKEHKKKPGIWYTMSGFFLYTFTSHVGSRLSHKPEFFEKYLSFFEKYLSFFGGVLSNVSWKSRFLT